MFVCLFVVPFENFSHREKDENIKSFTTMTTTTTNNGQITIIKAHSCIKIAVVWLIANFMDTAKTMDLSCMNIWLNNAVVFANIQISALWKNIYKKITCQRLTESTSCLWEPSSVSHFFGLVSICKHSYNWAISAFIIIYTFKFNLV